VDSKTKFNLEERLLDYSVAVIEFTERLPNNRVGNHLAGQLLRSSTSPLSNHGEAQEAESTNDFIHKMKICLKELKETRRWLLLSRRLSSLKVNITDIDRLIGETVELIKIFSSSIKTAFSNKLSDGSLKVRDLNDPYVES